MNVDAMNPDEVRAVASELLDALKAECADNGETFDLLMYSECVNKVAEAIARTLETVRAVISLCSDSDAEMADVESVYIGRVTDLYPSGKVYMPWTTNQTLQDMVCDNAYLQFMSDRDIDFVDVEGADADAVFLLVLSEHGDDTQ